MAESYTHIDKSLLSLVASGDEHAFRVLFDHYKDRFYFVALKMTGQEHIAEDIVQEVFLKLWRNRTSLSEIENADAYFFTILYRQVYQHYKKIALDKKMLQLMNQSNEAKNFTDEHVLAKESHRALEEAISNLPPQQQLIYRMNKLEGISYNEIAEKLNLSPNTVRNHLSTAVKSVRFHLKHLKEFAFLFGIFIRYTL